MNLSFNQYKQIVILTGAGISVASGLRTYRGPNGVWNECDVQEYGHVDRLRDAPEKIWQLFGPLRTQLKTASPNAAHVSLASLEQRLRPDQSFTLLTQNVDGLHQLAGSRHVVELHGGIGRTKCSNEKCTVLPFEDNSTYDNAVPQCLVCGSVLRPDIVLFGEFIPIQPGWEAKRALRDCDLFIAIGTSGTVAPASNYVRSAAYAGARTIAINLEEIKSKNPAYQEEYIGKAEEVLPALIGGLN